MIKIRVMNEPWYAGYSVGIFKGHNYGKILFEPYIENEIIPDDGILKLKQEEVQLLMDDLWRCGVRPSSGIGSVGQLEAVKYHLEDMRKLVFKEDKC